MRSFYFFTTFSSARWAPLTFSPSCSSPSATYARRVRKTERRAGHGGLCTTQNLPPWIPISTISVYIFAGDWETLQHPNNSCGGRLIICYYKPLGVVPHAVGAHPMFVDLWNGQGVVVCWRLFVSTAFQASIKFLLDVANTFTECFAINFFCDSRGGSKKSIEY
jgi:hypothetical protein